MKNIFVTDMIHIFRMKKLTLLFVLGIIVLGSLALLDLSHPGLPLTHDGKDHVARIANFYLNLTQGNIIPRWAPLLNWGYGHPVLMFLYPLPSYLASLFHFVGFSLIDSVKLVFGVSFILSGLSMYLFVQSFGNKYAAFIAGLLYMYAPYRFVDLYVRGAIGEHVAFVFAPLVFYFLYKVTKKNSPFNVILGSLSFACLILSHNAISLMFIPLFTLFSGYLIWKSERRLWTLFQMLLICGFGFLLSAFFWIPALLEGKYTLRDIVTENEYMNRFETIGRFIYSPWSYGGTGLLSVQVGVVQWGIVLCMPVLFFLKRKNSFVLRLIGGSLIVLFVLTLFIMLDVAKPLYELITTLQKFQFPWRFLTIIVFLTSLMGAVVVYVIPKKYVLGFVISMSVVLLFVNHTYTRANDYLTYPDSFYSSVYDGTTDTGESAPIWSVRFMEMRPTSSSQVIDGDARISEINRSATAHEYEIIAASPSRILENTLYFPGWEVYVNGNKATIEFQDPSYRGLMTYEIPEGRHTVLIHFGNTQLRTMAELLSLGAILGLVVYYFIYSPIHIWKRFQ